MELPRTLVTAAAGVYAANCTLGVSVARGWVDISRIRWVHHGLYIATSSLTAAACTVAVRGRPAVALALTPAALPLFLLQRHGAHPVRQHTRDALAAAPCYVVSLVLAWR